MTAIDTKMMKRALLTAFVVGPILTLVNQFDALFGDARFAWIQAGLTFLVPFAVSFTTSLMVKREQARAEKG